MSKARRQSLKAAVATKEESHNARADDLRIQAIEEPQKQIHAYIPESLHRAFKVKATEEGRNMSQLLESMIRDFVGM